jgi:hypothetical protein
MEPRVTEVAAVPSMLEASWDLNGEALLAFRVPPAAQDEAAVAAEQEVASST